MNGVPEIPAVRLALAYASCGWPVFPCKPGAKEPDTARGFLDATTDPDRIRGWWRSRPDRNLAIATGAPGPDVVDVDVRPAGSGFAPVGRLRRAGLLKGALALVRTPSGGYHLYYTGTAQPCGRLPTHFIDFKAAGGYVLAPPSAVGGRPYELVEHRGGTAEVDWRAVRAVLDPPQPPRRRGIAGDPARLADWVARLPEGNRNSGLYWAAHRAADEGHDPEILIDAAVQAGLPEPEARRTVLSAGRTRP